MEFHPMDQTTAGKTTSKEKKEKKQGIVKLPKICRLRETTGQCSSSLNRF